MKKILLGLFLGLTALSLSAPSFVNVKEIERKNYNIIADIDAIIINIFNNILLIFFFTFFFINA